MNFDDCICAHAFSFVPKLSYALDSELVCFDAVVFQGTWKWQYLKVWQINNQVEARVVWQSCVSFSVTSSSPHSKCFIVQLPFFVSLCSGVSAPRSRVLFHCKVAFISLTVWTACQVRPLFAFSLCSEVSVAHGRAALSRQVSGLSPIFSDFLFLRWLEGSSRTALGICG